MTRQEPSATRRDVDPVMVGLVSNRLHSLLAEQQSTLVRAAFSPVVRESMDLACAVFDSHGDMVGQSVGGTPGHINAMATGMQHIVSKYETGLRDGDVLITNDPWKTAGQINDITVATPVFRNAQLIAWFANCCHSPDIGGRILSAAASEVYEEGLRLPILKLLRKGDPDEGLEQIIRSNVRTPDETMGDIYAQVAANEIGARSLSRLLDETGLAGIDVIAEQIMNRSESALRSALSSIADGCYHASMETDGFGGEPLNLKATVTIDNDRAKIDYAGSSAQSRYGINVVLNYTRAYTSFAIKAALAPEVPHNAGSFRPVEVTAPPGSVLNCLEPAPVASRHLVGHFLPSLIFDALRPALAPGLPATSADALWMTVWRGNAEAAPFTLTTFGAGGTGARPTKDGLTTTGFPTGVRAAPTEVVETLTPLQHTQKVIRTDSGGAGKHRGGLGQILDVQQNGSDSWTLNANIDRVEHPAPGADNGRGGAAGGFESLDNGYELPRKQLVRIAADAHVRLSFPGGGGYGNPYDRPAETVLDDVINGYVSIDQAQRAYGVAIEYLGHADSLVRPPNSYHINEAGTDWLRSN